MKVLALDTSTDFISLACLENNTLVSEIHEEAGMKHSQILVSEIDGMLKALNWTIRDIDLIAAGIGPGSFTGLRIGVTTVKGIALVLGTAIAGISTMDAVAMRAPSGKGLIVPVLDAHKGKVYTCVYEKTCDGKLKRKTEELLCDVGELKTFVKEKAFFFGSGLKKYGDEIKNWKFAELDNTWDWFPRAADIGKIAIELKDKATLRPEALEPMYLYPKECNVVRGKG